MIYHSINNIYSDRLSDLAQTVAEAVEDLTPYLSQFDFIAVTGMSGALVGSPVAIALDKPLTLIRKDSDSNHGSPMIVGHLKGRYIFLDDFLASGKTRLTVIEKLKAYDRNQRYYDRNHKDMEYVGDYLYSLREVNIT